MDKNKLTYTNDDINCNDLIFSIEKIDGIKFIHFYGYGYDNCNSSDPEEQYSFVEYKSFYVPLSEIFGHNIFEIEVEKSEDITQYIEDCNYETMIDIYKTYDNGRCPILITQDKITRDIEEGIYIVKYT